MDGPDDANPSQRQRDANGAPNGPLPYRIELWDAGGRQLLALAARSSLAHAIYIAAQREHAGARVVLCQGSDILRESSDE